MIQLNYFCNKCGKVFKDAIEEKRLETESKWVEVGEDAEGYAILESKKVEVENTYYFCPHCNSKDIAQEVPFDNGFIFLNLCQQ